MRVLMLLLLIIIVGCNKPNPNPELADEIYSDLKASAGNAAKDVEAEEKKLEGFKKDLDNAVPQTGEIKFAQKRYFESEQRLQKFEQVQKYFELKAQDRLEYTRKQYAKAFRAGKTWPTEEEIQSYKKYKLLSNKEASWDSRKRVELYEKERGLSNRPKSKPEGEKKAETKSAKE